MTLTNFYRSLSRLAGIAALLTSLITSMAFADTIRELSAEVGRTSTNLSFNIKVKVTRISQENIAQDSSATSSVAENYLRNNVLFRLTSLNRAIPYNEIGFGERDYRIRVIDVTVDGQPDSSEDDEDNFVVEAELVVEAFDQEAFDEIFELSEDQFSACFYENEGAPPVGAEFEELPCKFTEQKETVTQDLSVVDDAPELLSAAEGAMSINFTWSGASTVMYKSGDSTSNKAFDNYYLILAKKDDGPFNLPSRDYEGGAREADTSGTNCSFDPADASCIICDNTRDDYIDIPALESSSLVSSGQVRVAKIAADQTSLRVGSLTDDVEYAGFLVYAPDALQQSICLSATPYKGGLPGDLVGEPEANEDFCLIRSASKNTPIEKTWKTFRSFRDQYLAKSKLGRNVIDFYYHQLSPFLAPRIENSRSLKTLIQGALVISEPVLAAIEAKPQY